METKVNLLLVGLFVLLLGAAVIAGVIWLGAGGVRTDVDRFVVYTSESVSGLTVDAPVRYRGVKVGRVAGIALAPGDPSRVRLLLEIDRGTPIKRDTIATLEMQGLTGLKNVNLLGGSAAAPPLLPDDDRYPVIESRPSILSRLDDQASRLAESITETAERLNRLLSEENQVKLSLTIAHLEEITAAVARESGAIAASIADLRQAARQGRRASAALPEAVERFNRAARAIERMAGELGGAGAAVKREVAEGGGEMRRFMESALPQAALLVEEMRETAANLRRASEAIESDPSILLYGAAPPEPGPGER